jgi:cation transport ATPase
VISKLVTVTHDPAAISPAAIVAALNGVGLRAQLLGGGHHGDGAAARDADGAAGPGGAPAGWRPPWVVLACGALVAVSTFAFLAPPRAAVWLEAFGLAAAALGCPPVLSKAWSSLKGRVLDINALMVVAGAGAVALGDWSEAGALVFLFTLAEWLEAKCMGRAAGALEGVLRMQPETALLLEPAGSCGAACGADCGATCGAACAPSGSAGSSPKKPGAARRSAAGSPRKAAAAARSSAGGGGGGGGGSFVRVPAAQLAPGDLVLVRPGDRVPVDGTVTAGSSAVDESMLTGESRAVPKAAGARALAGTVNSGTAALTVRVDAAPGDSTVARLGALIEAAQQSKSKRDRAIEVGGRRSVVQRDPG